MSASGQRLGLRLFLEGIEVPVVAAQVQIGINAPAAASIQIVPSDRVLEFKARTMVHLFFWDYTQDFGGEASLEGDDELKGYKLLFSGEVIGVTMMKTPVGRQAVLQCSDFSTYWDTTYQFMISYGPGGNFLGSSAAVWAGGASLFNDIIDGHGSVMNSFLRSRPKTDGLTDVKGLMGGIIRLLEAMGGVPNHTHGVNDFFTIAELKNHILQQIVAEQNDDTAQRLFDAKTFMAWLNNSMSSLGQLTTFRDMLKLLFKYVYYETVPNPAAMYVPGERSTSKTTVKNVKVGLPDDDISASLREKLRDMRNVAATASEGNTVNVNTLNQWTTTLKSDLRKILAIAAPNRFVAQANDLGSEAILIANNVAQGIVAYLPVRVRAHLKTALVHLESVVPMREGGSARLAIADNTPIWKQVVQAFDRALQAAGSRTVTRQKRKTEKTKPKLDRLNSQIFRPDCFFAAPPQCNVIFPEQYTQFTFTKNFLQEVTRLRLSTGWMFGGGQGGGVGGIFNQYHFAPATKDIKAAAKQQGNGSIRALLPWEIYSGILPKFESIHEMNYIAGRSERRLGIKNKNTRGQSTSYAQRAANFNFLKYRFAARSCEISCKFNPGMICGFPAAVIERPFTPTSDELQKALGEVNAGREQKIAADDISDHIRDIARAVKAPTQYLGMVAALGHTVGQDGGATSVTLTHARSHRITDDDFLNVYTKELTKEAETETVNTILDAEELIAKGDWKNIQMLIDATPQDLDREIINLLLEEEDAREKELTPDPDDDIAVEDRPTGFAPLLDPKAPEQKTQLAISEGEVQTLAGRHTIRGRTKEEELDGTNITISVPAGATKLKPGSKGPKGGEVTQIQLFTDGALAILGSEINKKASKVVQFYGDFHISPNEPQRVMLLLAPGGTAVLKAFTPTKRKKVDRVKANDVLYMWKKVAIYEKVDTKRKIAKLIPIEEALRPPWFSPLYSNWFIGDNIYRPFFGTGSVVDEAVFVSPEGTATFGTSRGKQQQLLEELEQADGDNAKIMQILERAKADSLSDIPDIESSLDVLAYLYGEVRRLGLDVHKFVHDYTRRPIATMEDILGSADLEYKVEDVGGKRKLTLVTGDPGFHSTAVGKFDSLLGLVDDPDYERPRIHDKGKKSPLSKLLDPRPGRREKVQAYIDDISASSGSLGVGVAG